MPDIIGVVLKGWPRLSETFIAQELAALQRRGLALQLISLRHPTDLHRHPVHDEVTAPVTYLPEYLRREPVRVLRGWLAARRLPGYAAARRLWLRDLRRDPSPNRVRRFGQAMVLAAELPPGVRHLHAHFLHTPGSVARYAARMLGLAWSVSAHAKDIWTTPDWEKREKLADAAWVVSCTRAGRDHLAALADGTGVELVHHGLDERRFPAFEAPRPARDGGDPADPVRLLVVGRAVPKKGLELLLAVLAQLPAGLHWRLAHVGGGPLLPALKTQAEALGLSSRIEWLGPQPQEVVLARYRDSDLFVLTSRIAEDGDRDGLPNVLMEAMSQSCPVLATRVAAIPELVEDGASGMLVPADDTDAVAAALARLIREPGLRVRLGAAGAARVREHFVFARGAERIAVRLRELVAAAPVRGEAAAVSPIAAIQAECASPSTRP